MTYFSPTDLIINPDGSTYHLHIRPDQLPHKIIMVGDPERVPFVSKYFDKIDYKIHKREFVSHIGQFRNQSIGVISSGIGADNVEIVMNELDALANIDFKTRYAKDQKISLELIRIGTSGSIQEDVSVDSFLVSKAAIGFDNLAQFYGFESPNMLSHEALNSWCQQINYKLPVYGAKASGKLVKQFSSISQHGYTLTAPGFYAPQGRTVRMKSLLPDFLSDVSMTKFEGEIITNIEMETAAYYAFSASLGHEMISLNAILANRLTHEFSKDPEGQIKQLIELTLNLIA
ncbi:MAG: phosphorylase [Cytophagia bacterium]|nr:phosphorylase [Cytophagia bacterium]